jgi:outer membrane protein OmpU
VNMKNITKLGLTALAGSLVASASYAGSMDVSGSAKITHASADETEVQGNSFSNSKGISFSGSGELDNGYTVSTTYTMSDAAFSSSQVTIDMGDMGTVGLWNNANGAGINKYSDVIPTAGEQVWDDSDSDDNGIPTHENDNMVGYNGTFGNVGVSLAYVNGGNGSTGGAASDSSWVLTYDGLIDGLTLGIGQGENGETVDLQTMYAKYTSGALTVGYQISDLDNTGSTADEEAIGIGASFAINDNLSVSAGRHEVDMGAGKVDETSTGFSASYTSGGVTIGFVANSTEDVAGTAGSDDSYREIAVSFAF